MNNIDLSGVKVGDTVYIVSEDGRDKPYESVVKTVGRKYITLDSAYYAKFNKENGISVEWPQWRLYPSKRAYEVEQEKHNMMRSIRRNFERCDFCYYDLKTIYNMVKSALERRGLEPI